ncbi:acyl-CoA dehydrogenase family protein [Nocardia niigatensis]
MISTRGDHQERVAQYSEAGDRVRVFDAGTVVSEIFRAEFAGPMIELVDQGRDGATVALDRRATGGLFGTGVEVRVSDHPDHEFAVSGEILGAYVDDRTDGLWLPIETDSGRTRFGLVAFGSPGVTVRPGESWLSGVPIADIRVDNAPLAAVSETGLSFSAFPRIIGTARLFMVAVALASLDAALTEALDYAVARPMNGARLIDQQAVRYGLSDVGARLWAARAAFTAAATAAEVREMNARGAALAGYLATVLPESVTACCQVLGGRGFLRRFEISRHYRDAPGLATLLGEVSPSYEGWS